MSESQQVQPPNKEQPRSVSGLGRMIIGLRNFFYRPEKTPQTASTQINPLDVLMEQVRLHAEPEVAQDEASRENQRLDAVVAALERATQQPVEEDPEVLAIMEQFKSPQ